MELQHSPAPDKGASRERPVSVLKPLLPGYQYIPKGDPYITRHCRIRTLAAGIPLYVVHVDGKPSSTLGLRVPDSIAEAVLMDAAASKDTRARAVERRDDREMEDVRMLMAKRWPKLPALSVETVLRHAFAKKSGRVGRIGAMDLSRRIELAVYAHARHMHTRYEKLVKTMPRDQARREIQKELDAITQQWAGSARTVPKRVKSKRPIKPRLKEKARPQGKGHQTRRSTRIQKSKAKRATKAS